MDIQSSTINVQDYCAMHDRSEITINRDYQRSDEVWPRAAQTFLIETILLGYPVPKLFLHQKTDIKLRRSVKDVVDGQQRTKAIVGFYQDEYRLGRNLEEIPEAAGKNYSELPEELKGKFLGYGLDFDIFIQATDEEVREVFRRMNSFTVPLNAEEQRHATYQGPFKWFVRRIASDYDTALINAGTFSQKQIVRMQDAKLITEIASAYFDGITTTKKPQLDRVYRLRNAGDSFKGQDDLEKRVRAAFDDVLGLKDLYGTPILSRTHVMYSLLLATMHIQAPVPKLREHFKRGKRRTSLDTSEKLVNLTKLADAIENDDRDGEFKSFVVASAEKTNVAGPRIMRFQWLCRALTEPLDS